MSDPLESSAEAPSSGRGSPAPGCCILAAIVGVFGGLVVLYTVVGFYQHRAIATFTQETAATLAVDAPSASQVEAAKAKLRQIEAAVAEGRAERILFTVEDLNALIASLDEAADFQGSARVERIGTAGIVVEMAQPVRKGLFKKGFRYLNGSFVLEPELRARTVAFKVVSIDPAVGEVPKPFVDSYASLDLFRLDPEIPALKANVSSLASVYTEEGQLVVETKVGDAKADAVP